MVPAPQPAARSRTGATDRAHPHPLYGEHFALGDVPAGTYVLHAEKDGRPIGRPVEVTVAAGQVTWVEFR